MGILFCMAACAIPRQAAVLVRGAVAGGAGYLLVRSGQRVFAIGMVERTSIESDEAEVAPLVVGMAGLAGAAASLGELAMKMRTLRDVSPDPFVACGAARVLRCLLKRGVAGGAIRFQTRVDSGKRARRDQPFHQALRQGGG